MSLRGRLSAVREGLAAAFGGKERIDLTSGSIGKPLLFLSLPIVITNLMQTAYNLADTFWLGQYSTEALAAVTFAFPMVFLLISLGMGISVAGSVLVAQHTGAGEEREAEFAASQTVTFAVLASAALGAVAYFLVDDVLVLLGAAPDVLPGATAYMRVISVGLVFMFGFFVFIALMRGYGDTVTPMLVMFGSVVLNIALDPFVVFGWWVFPELGIEGAAIATIFSRALAFVVGLAVMFRGTRGVRIRLSQMRPDFGQLVRVVRVGAPASIEMTVRSLSINALLFIVGSFSTTVVASFGIGIRVFSVMFLPAVAVGRGVETMTGQNLGAGKPDRAAAANHFAARWMFVVLLGVGVVAWLAAEPIVSVFTDNPAVVADGATLLRFAAPTFCFIGAMRAYAGGFRGSGKTLVSAVIAFVMAALVRLPIAWVASRALGPTGIWVAFPVSNLFGGVLAYLWFRRGTWRSADLTDTPVSHGAPDAEDD